MPRRLFLTVVLSLILLPLTIAFADFSGKVVSVTDGDTLDVLHDGRTERILDLLSRWGLTPDQAIGALAIVYQEIKEGELERGKRTQ